LSDLDFHHFLLLALRVALAVVIPILLTGIVDGLEIGLIVATPGLALFIAGSAITESGLALSVW
jgi:flagellar biosynthesis protein FliQ